MPAFRTGRGCGLRSTKGQRACHCPALIYGQLGTGILYSDARFGLTVREFRDLCQLSHMGKVQKTPFGAPEFKVIHAAFQAPGREQH